MTEAGELPQASPAPPLLVVLSGPVGIGQRDAGLSPARPGTALAFRGHRYHPAHARGRSRWRGLHFPGCTHIFADEGADELLESAQVYDRWYGVPRQQVRDPLIAGKDVILEIDVQGAATIRDLAPEALTIFVMPASMAELRNRLSARGTEDDDEMKRRLQEASVEIGRINEFDYRVVNRNGALDDAVREIDAIIAAEKCRVSPRLVQML